jgi:DNA-binding transcriptional ArsR family regulator
MTDDLLFDAYVIDTLLPDLVGHDRQPSAFLVYLYLWRHTRSRELESVEVSLLDISEAVGISKRSVQEALRTLTKRALVGLDREGITAVGRYSVRAPWRRSDHPVTD